MYDKTKDLFDAFVKSQMSRRELMRASAKLGLGAAATGVLLNQAQTRAMAADFDWMKYKGSKLKLLLKAQLGGFHDGAKKPQRIEIRELLMVLN